MLRLTNRVGNLFEQPREQIQSILPIVFSVAVLQSPAGLPLPPLLLSLSQCRFHTSKRGAFSRPRSVPPPRGVVRRSRVASHLCSPQGTQSARVVHHETRSRQAAPKELSLSFDFNFTTPSLLKAHALAPNFPFAVSHHPRDSVSEFFQQGAKKSKDKCQLTSESGLNLLLQAKSILACMLVRPPVFARVQCTHCDVWIR